MKTKYTIAIEKGNDQMAYGVLFPDLEGCLSAGDSFEEAVSNAKEALDFHLVSLIKDGVEIPIPKHLSEHAKNPEYEGLILTTIDTSVITKSQATRLLTPLHSILKLIKDHQVMYDPHGPLSYNPRVVYQAELKLLKQIGDILDEYESSLDIEDDEPSVKPTCCKCVCLCRQ